MIKKLRVKFVALAMGALAAVLAVILGSVSFLNYWAVVEEADETLEILADNDGVFPKNDKQRKDKGGFGPESPERPYEIRYFSVVLNDAGGIRTVDTGKIAAVDTETAIAYAQRVVSEGKQRGFLEDYRYARTAVPDGGARVVFLDCGRSLAAFRRFVATSCSISLLCAAVVFVLMLLLSGRIIRPVADSYDKQKRFITDAGHEIKTPLTVIAADADVLKMDIGENEWLRDIQKQTAQLGELTDSLICLSRMEEDENQFQMIDFPLSDVVGETAQSYQALAQAQGKTFSAAVQPMLSLRGDERAIRRLVAILLDNALKYSPPAGEISLTLEKRGRAVCLRVYNTAAQPIDRESLSHWFERFYRGDKARGSATPGYGIGLSIAQAVTAAHKGKITAASPDGRALTMTVTLPL